MKTKPPRPPGRPVVDEPRQSRSFVLHPDEWARYKLAAGVMDVTLAQWVRLALRRAYEEQRESAGVVRLPKTRRRKPLTQGDEQ